MNTIAENTVIATCTLYNLEIASDICRAELALKMIANAIKHGYEVVLVDGGSPVELKREFAKTGAKVFEQAKPGMGNSRRQAFQECIATKKPVIAYVDPEKFSYIDELHRTVEPIAIGAADMVIPCRRSMETYPTAQRYNEPFINSFWKDLTHTSYDVSFGPKTFKKELASYFLNYHGEYGDKWDAIYVPILDVLHHGHRIAEVTIDYIHPKDQTHVEEHDLGFYWKRLHQMDNVMGALERHWQKIHIH
jgi:hypothetical protein